MIDLLGWAGAIILLLTVGRQVYTQWKAKSDQGVSRWLFIGQISASIVFVAYSWLLENWVFLATNLSMLLTAIAGQIIYLRNKAKSRSSPNKFDNQ